MAAGEDTTKLDVRGLIIGHSSRSELIQEQLRAAIIDQRLKEGDVLPTEKELCKSLGVSRSVVREALSGMESLGLIEARQGVGRVVCSFSFRPILENLLYGLVFRSGSILQITEIRKALDAHFVQEAMDNLSDEDIETLSDLVALMESKTEAGLNTDAEDYQFHQLLYRRTDNPLALELFEITWQARAGALEHLSETPLVASIPHGSAPEHKPILEAIKERDSEAARRAIVAHHWNIQEQFRQAVDLGV